MNFNQHEKICQDLKLIYLGLMNLLKISLIEIRKVDKLSENLIYIFLEKTISNFQHNI